MTIWTSQTFYKSILSRFGNWFQYRVFKFYKIFRVLRPSIGEYASSPNQEVKNETAPTR